LGLAFVFAVAHVFFIASDISTNFGLKIYILALAAAALLSRLYRIIWRHSLTDKYNYAVVAVRTVGPSAVEIELVPKEKKMPYVAGQFSFFEFRDPGIGREEHPFSLASSPADENIKIVVKALGDYTDKLKNLPPGTDVIIEGPYGEFNFRNFAGKEQIWIAGGIGITPFLGMARDLASGPDYKITLYYCAKTDEEMMYFDELKEISEKSGGFKVIGFCQNRDGYISADAIRATSGDFLSKDILLCGPPAMMAILRKQFVASGVPNKNIHSEEFEF
jgi:predicted ferric reductase